MASSHENQGGIAGRKKRDILLSEERGGGDSIHKKKRKEEGFGAHVGQAEASLGGRKKGGM